MDANQVFNFFHWLSFLPILTIIMSNEKNALKFNENTTISTYNMLTCLQRYRFFFKHLRAFLLFGIFEVEICLNDTIQTSVVVSFIPISTKNTSNDENDLKFLEKTTIFTYNMSTQLSEILSFF